MVGLDRLWLLATGSAVAVGSFAAVSFVLDCIPAEPFSIAAASRRRPTRRRETTHKSARRPEFIPVYVDFPDPEERTRITILKGGLVQEVLDSLLRDLYGVLHSARGVQRDERNRCAGVTTST